MSTELRCAACGERIRSRKKALRVRVWDEEEVETLVCSAACRRAYQSGLVGPEAAKPRLEREILLAAGVAVVAAATDIGRAAMSYWLADPLGMVAPWTVELASAIIWIVLAFGLLRRRSSARFAALAVGVLTAIANISTATAGGDARALFVPVSVTVPLFVLLLGRPGTGRQALAASLALLLPIYLIWQLAYQLNQRWDSLERIERATVSDEVASSGAGGIRMDLAEDWRALRPNNDIVEWPHSDLELEVIEPSSGAVAFVVLDEDCDRDELTELQERSLGELAEARGAPLPLGISRIDDRTIEMRVQIQRGRARLTSLDIFRELDPRAEAGEGARPGCVWTHCLAPPGEDDWVRSDCRQMASTIRWNEGTP